MDETGVLGLIEELSILLEDSKPVFGKGNLRQVDIAAAFEIMDEIRDTFPGEFAQARQIVRERQSLIDDAEAESARLIEDARSQAMTIASEQEIVRIAQQQADTIMADARELERQTRAGAEDYAGTRFSATLSRASTRLSRAFAVAATASTTKVSVDNGAPCHRGSRRTLRPCGEFFV